MFTGGYPLENEEKMTGIPWYDMVWHGMTMTISTGKYQWPCNRNQQEPIFFGGSYHFFRRPIVQAYVREYPHKIFKIWKSHWKYGKYDWYLGMTWYDYDRFLLLVFSWFLLVFVTGILLLWFFAHAFNKRRATGPTGHRPHDLELALLAILRRGLHRNSAAPVVQNHTLQRSGLSGPGRRNQNHTQSPVRTKSSRPFKSRIVYKSFSDRMIKDYLHYVSLSSEAKAYSCTRDTRMHESYLNC